MPPRKIKIVEKPNETIKVNSDDVEPIEIAVKKQLPIILKSKLKTSAPTPTPTPTPTPNQTPIIKTDIDDDIDVIEDDIVDDEEKDVKDDKDKDDEEKDEDVKDDEDDKDKDDEEKDDEEKDDEEKDDNDKDKEKDIKIKTKTTTIKKQVKEKPKSENTILKQTESSFDMFGDNVIDYRKIMKDYDCSKNKTLPKITKYERALIIGKRAKQIEDGANPNIKVIAGQSSIEIAEEELRKRVIPFFIKRPNGNTFEYWKPADMEVLMD